MDHTHGENIFSKKLFSLARPVQKNSLNLTVPYFPNPTKMGPILGRLIEGGWMAKSRSAKKPPCGSQIDKSATLLRLRLVYGELSVGFRNRDPLMSTIMCQNSKRISYFWHILRLVMVVLKTLKHFPEVGSDRK